MYSTFYAFNLVRGLTFDLASTMCHCCSCGDSIPADEAYADSIGRTWCFKCIMPARIASIYEVAIHEVTRYLDRLEIPYEDPESFHDGYVIRFPWCEGDVACHYGTYGSRTGKLETYGFSEDNGDVSGFLTPLQAVEIVLHEWNEYNKQIREQKG